MGGGGAYYSRWGLQSPGIWISAQSKFSFTDSWDHDFVFLQVTLTVLNYDIERKFLKCENVHDNKYWQHYH